MKKKQINLGRFNRIVFQEGAKYDMCTVGDRAYCVNLTNEFRGLEFFSNENEVHRYFIRKYFEGFKKIDQEFKTELVAELEETIEKQFKLAIYYDVKSKQFANYGYLIFRYRYNSFQLVAQCSRGDKNIGLEKVLYECEPDPFKVHHDIHKITVDNGEVIITGLLNENIGTFTFPI
ncbi:hypothetical protein [Saccharobesus litoralis]|nr:hypothetical protein [Saccharobesus litoralis]